MTLSTNAKVDNFLRDTQALSAKSFDTVMVIRKLFLDEKTDLVEEIKYGGVVFLKSGVSIGGIFLYKNHLSIEFSDGVKFDDPESLLEGKGKLRRHLKIQNMEDIENKKAGFFVKQALACNG